MSDISCVSMFTRLPPGTCWADLDDHHSQKPDETPPPGFTLVSRNRNKLGSGNGISKPIMVPGNRLINCRNCKIDFTFTRQKQAQYFDRGWESPKTCKECRKNRVHN